MGACSARVYMVSSWCRSGENIHDQASSENIHDQASSENIQDQVSSESSRDKVTVQCSAIYLGFALGMVNSCNISVKQQQIRCWFRRRV